MGCTRIKWNGREELEKIEGVWWADMDGMAGCPC